MPKAIGIERNDGSIEAIYVHGDGLVESVIDVVRRHYKTEKAVSSLIGLGSLSQIGRSIGEKHDFDSHDETSDLGEWCLAYHRDRGESWDDNKPSTFKSRAEYGKQAERLGVDRLYLFDPKAGDWFWYTRRKWMPVSPAPRTECRR